jgi:hypothetical protein
MQKWKAQVLLQGQERGLPLLTIRLKRNLSWFLEGWLQNCHLWSRSCRNRRL